jgi:hypothetical protein
MKDVRTPGKILINPTAINWHQPEPRLQQCTDSNVINKVPPQQMFIGNQIGSDVPRHEEPGPRSEKIRGSFTDITTVKSNR